MVCNNCVQHFREVTIYSTSDIGYHCSLYCGFINQISWSDVNFSSVKLAHFRKRTVNHKRLTLFPQHFEIDKLHFTSRPRIKFCAHLLTLFRKALDGNCGSTKFGGREFGFSCKQNICDLTFRSCDLLSGKQLLHIPKYHHFNVVCTFIHLKFP